MRSNIVFFRIFLALSIFQCFSFQDALALQAPKSKPKVLLFNGWLWPLPGGGINHFLYFHKNYAKYEKAYATELFTPENTFPQTQAAKLGLSCNTFRFPLDEWQAYNVLAHNEISIVTFPRWEDFAALKQASNRYPVKLVLVQQGTIDQNIMNNIQALKGLDGIVGHNQDMTDYFLWANRHYNLGIKKITTIAPCWDERHIDEVTESFNVYASRSDFFKKRFGLDINNQWPLICTIANMADPVKNQQLLINALSIIIKQKKKNVYAVLAGEGALRSTLEKLVKDLGLEKYVYILGPVLDAPWLLNYCDMHILPSNAEGFPVVNIEASYMGKPVIAANNTGGAFLIDHMKTGLLFDNNDVVSLSQNIELLLNNGPLREQLGKAAAENIKNNYLNRALFKQWNKFFTGL